MSAIVAPRGWVAVVDIGGSIALVEDDAGELRGLEQVGRLGDGLWRVAAVTRDENDEVDEARQDARVGRALDGWTVEEGKARGLAQRRHDHFHRLRRKVLARHHGR